MNLGHKSMNSVITLINFLRLMIESVFEMMDLKYFS